MSTPQVHDNCNCTLDFITAIKAGTATIHGIKGVDYYLKNTGTLSDNYITKEEAEKKGWIQREGNLATVLPDTFIAGNIYYNDDDILPISEGRIWYEADINYLGLYRNKHRVLYSSDGLIFVSYDHYKSFHEIN